MATARIRAAPRSRWNRFRRRVVGAAARGAGADVEHSAGPAVLLRGIRGRLGGHAPWQFRDPGLCRGARGAAARPPGGRRRLLRVFLSPVRGGAPDLGSRSGPAPNRALIEFERAAEGINRIWWRVASRPGEHVWGCGEQMSYFDLRGRTFPLWTSEPGVGRDKSTHLTWQADVAGESGGDYYTTNYPQPTFVSSSHYAFMPRRPPTRTSIFAIRISMSCSSGRSRVDRADRGANLRRPGRADVRKVRPAAALPDWVFRGAILGLKNGARPCRENSGAEPGARSAGVGALVRGLGRGAPNLLRPAAFLGLALERETVSGRPRLGRLPQFRGRCASSATPIHTSAATAACIGRRAMSGYLATTMPERGDYRVDFGEFTGGVVDFTNPEAAALVFPADPPAGDDRRRPGRMDGRFRRVPAD